MDISRGANYLHTKSTRMLTSHFTRFPDNAIVVIITSIKLEIVKLKSLLKSKMSEEYTVLSTVCASLRLLWGAHRAPRPLEYMVFIADHVWMRSR